MKRKRYREVKISNSYMPMGMLLLLGFVAYVGFTPKVLLQCNLPDLTQKRVIKRMGDDYPVTDIYLGKDFENKDKTCLQLGQENYEKSSFKDIYHFIDREEGKDGPHTPHIRYVALWIDKSVKMGDVQDVCMELRKAEARRIIYISK